MKFLSLFSGIGAPEKGLVNRGIKYDLVGFSEIDKYASKSYCVMHNVDPLMNLGDITKIDEKTLPKNIDLLTYGFPCQDISLAGQQKGLFNEDGTLTRSGLFFDALRIIKETQPKVAIAENVKNLTGKKFKEQFKIVLDSLEEAGYNNYWQILNAKDFGIPQNRERVFIVSIRKDIDTGMFQFPEGFPLNLRLKDMLDTEVEEKYYIKEDRMKIIRQNLGDVFNENFVIASSQKNAYVGDDSICPTLTTAMGNGGGQTPMIKEVSDRVISVGNVNPSGKGQNGLVIDSEGLARTITQEKGEGQKILVREEPKVNQIGNWCPGTNRPNPNQGRIYDTEGLAPTLSQMGGGNRQPFVVEPSVLNPLKDKTPYGWHFEQQVYNPNGIARALKAGGGSGNIPKAIVENESPTVAVAMRGRYNEEGKVEQQIEFSDREYANAITTVQKDSLVAESMLRIRKLTPKECFRLQGFIDSDWEKAASVNSNTQLYKQAGNSICVPVLEHIYKAISDSGVLDI